LGTGPASFEASTAPSQVAPSDFVATPGDHEIDLSWDSMLGATSYNLYRSTTPGGEGTTPYQTGLTETGYSDPQTTSTAYYYTVTAVYPSGEGAQSMEASAAAELAAPAAPTGLTAIANGTSEIDLSWTAGSAGGGPVDSYVIEQSTDGTNFSYYDEVDGSTTTYEDTGASDGTTYYYAVYASNAVGDSASTASANAATSLAPPTNLTADGVSDTEIDLSWSNASATASGISISRSTDNVNFTPLTTLAATATTYTDDDASPGTTYYYQVTATEGSAMSTAAAANAQTTPANLTTLTATANAPSATSSVVLSWTPVTGATGYEIDRQDSSGNWQEYDAVESGTATGYTDTGVQDGMAYTYRVLPYNDSGTSDQTSAPTASATTLLIKPTNVTAVALSSTSIEIVWDDASTSETGYEVQRSTDGVNFTDLGSTAAGVTNYTDTPVAPSTHYWYQVESTNSAAGRSVPSDSDDVTTPSASGSDAGPATATLSVRGC
jgi:hypothetical protein